MPERRCLECLEQYNPGLVSAEREGLLDDPSYIAGLPDDHPMKRNENVIAFSMNVAALEVLQMIMLVVRPLGLGDLGQLSVHFVPGIFEKPTYRNCNDTCPYPNLAATGEASGFISFGQHTAAEMARAKRANSASSPRADGWLVRLLKLSGLKRG